MLNNGRSRYTGYASSVKREEIIAKPYNGLQLSCNHQGLLPGFAAPREARGCKLTPHQEGGWILAPGPAYRSHLQSS